jgi:type IV secretion system protein VirB8
MSNTTSSTDTLSLAEAPSAGVTPEQTREFLGRAQTWHTDAQLRAEQEAKRWRWAFWGALALAGVSAAGYPYLLPLKETQVGLVTVDEDRHVQLVGMAKNAHVTPNEAINKYFLSRYVRYREGYTRAEADTIYTTVSLMSAPGERLKWEQYFHPEYNPKGSPIAKFAEHTQVRIDIKNVSPIAVDAGAQNQQLAAVRFVRHEESASERKPPTYWIATVAYTYGGPPSIEEQRMDNPLGLSVLNYRVDPEALNAGTTVDSASAGASR